MVSQLLGTDTDFDTKDCILFLEDLDEHLYHLDRMMVHLLRAGKLEQLAGLVIGGFTDLNDNDTPFGKTIEEIIADAVPDYTFDTDHGTTTLTDLFGGRDTLLVIHNMGQGCRYCTLWGDGISPFLPHLRPAD